MSKYYEHISKAIRIRRAARSLDTSYQILYEAFEGTAAKLLEVARDAKESLELASQEKEKHAKILDAASQALDKADRDLEVLETLWDTHKVRIHEWLAEKEKQSGGQ